VRKCYACSGDESHGEIATYRLLNNPKTTAKTLTDRHYGKFTVMLHRRCAEARRALEQEVPQ
jgi:hypothetical protein